MKTLGAFLALLTMLVPTMTLAHQSSPDRYYGWIRSFIGMPRSGSSMESLTPNPRWTFIDVYPGKAPCIQAMTAAMEFNLLGADDKDTRRVLLGGSWGFVTKNAMGYFYAWSYQCLPADVRPQQPAQPTD